MMLLCAAFMQAQDLSSGLQVVNDLGNYPMQNMSKPAYLDSYVDPSFGTTIRRISNVGNGGVIKPMYSTIQAWNADESYMILYERGRGHQLLDGMTYQFIRYLDDIRPDDIEQIFWDFDDPNIFYYVDNANNDLIRYRVNNSSKQVIVNLGSLTNCGNIIMGNDVQMMSWDSDIVSFRCNNQRAYSYSISTGTLREFNFSNGNLEYTAPMPGPSGDRFYHRRNIYGSNGNYQRRLNESKIEHSCTGQLANGDDGHFAIAFSAGQNGGCQGNIIQHNMRTGECTPLISEGQGYPYPKSGTHISALAHKNTQGGWVAASMVGFQEDGQSLLDQELVVARADQNGNVTVCRIGHHRSDENEFDYFGEPHASISPTGTRVVFASDWSGSQDGQSIDTYVVELPTFGGTPPPPPSGDNSLSWDTEPTSISTGNNSFTMDYSINQNGVVFIQVFDENWNKIDDDYQVVSSGTKRITLNLDVPNGAASANNNHLQAMLFNSDWTEELATRLELDVSSGSTPPPPPPTSNSLKWNPTPTSISGGTNNFTLDYSINQNGIVFIQVFDKDWNRFDYYTENVSTGSRQVTLPLSVSSPSANNNHLQAFLLSSDWSSEFERLELDLPSGNAPPPPPPSSGNSLKWSTTPTSISNGNNSFTMDYSIDKKGVVFIQVFDENWNKIDQDYRDVSAGENRITLDLDVPNGAASSGNNNLQAMLLNSSWVEMTDVPRLEETLNFSSNKLETESMSFNVFPNPFSHAFNIEYHLTKSQAVSIQLFTQEGKRVKVINKTNQAAGNHIETVTIDNLPSGMYLLHLTTSDSHGVQKLVKF